LTDFGISEGSNFDTEFVLSSADLSGVNLVDKNKNNDNILGTENYMSPEIVNGLIERGEGDYWSLGVIIYYIYTRTLPFEGKNKYETFDNITDYKINWEKLQKSKIDPDLFNLVKGFLAYEIKERTCTLRQVKEHKFFKGNNTYIIK